MRRNNNITEELLIHSMNWDEISKKTNLSNRFILRYKNYINWGILLQHNDIEENIIEQCLPYIPVTQVLKYKKLSERFIEKHIISKNLWGDLCRFQKLSENFIHKYAKNVKWEHIIRFQEISYNFLINHIKYFNEQDWITLSIVKREILTDNFIIKYKKKLYWDYLSQRDKEFSNKVLAECCDMINWRTYIYLHNKISEDILTKYIDYIKIRDLLRDRELSEDFLIKNIDVIGWDNISKYAHIDKDFLKKYRFKINWEFFKNKNSYFLTFNKYHLYEKLKPNKFEIWWRKLCGKL